MFFEEAGIFFSLFILSPGLIFFKEAALEGGRWAGGVEGGGVLTDRTSPLKNRGVV